MKTFAKFIMPLALTAALHLSAEGKTTVADYTVIPLPQQITTADNSPFILTQSATISFPKGNAEMERNAQFLSDYLQPALGSALKISATPGGEITLKLDDKIKTAEGYHISVDSRHGIVITGSTPAGVFYGIQTLRKSIAAGKGLQRIEFPAVEITDSPRFSYRGTMLDVSRHFMPADSVKEIIDILALHNINRMHWHLTDDQGWRIEIKKYPELTKVGAMREGSQIGKNFDRHDSIPYGGFYTQQEIRDIVKYAAERHITIIPEIDLPGHQLAALATYPDLGCTGGPYKVWTRWGVADDVICAGNEKAMRFLEDVLAEVISLFPSEYIHIGGDECPKTRWADCPKCQAKIKELGIKADNRHSAEEYLQSYVISRMEKFVESKGRHIIGWDEILEGGLAPNATVMSWRGVDGGIEAAKQHHNVIMTPNTYLYFDYYQTKNVKDEPLAIGGYIPLERVLSFEPTNGIPKEYQSYVIGVQANLWTEYIPSLQQAEYMLLPRLAALAEVQWSSLPKPSYEEFLPRLKKLTDWYNVLGYNFATHIFDIKPHYTIDERRQNIIVELEQLTEGNIYYTLDGTTPTEKSTRYTTPFSINRPSNLKAILINGSTKSHILSERIVFNKATVKPIELKTTLHPQYTYGGASMLVDGLKGGEVFRDGRWVGVNRNDIDVVIDFGQPTSFSEVTFDTFVSVGDWIMDVSKIAILSSADGKNFQPILTKDVAQLPFNTPQGIHNHKVTFDQQNARYIRIVLSPDKLPKGHPKAGINAFLFVDEIEIK